MVSGRVLDATEFPETYNRKQRPKDEGRRTHRETTTTKPFVAWDGEGYSDDTGEHHYMLFGNSEGVYVTGESLTWEQCFPLLVNSPNANNVIFGGDYDVIMMIRSMPWIVREKLFKGEWVRYAGYVMQWRRRKYFLLKHRASGKSTILYDVQSFFQTSFVKACREYLGESEALDDMHAMKLQRDAFILGDDRVISYWQSELDYLVRLMNCLRDLLLAVNIKPSGWYGPGAVANRVLRREGMQRFYEDIPDHITDLAERAYYGGRFEQLQTGRLRNVVEYDIRSAYPHAISKLPHFGALWVRDDSTLGSFSLCFVSWNIPSRHINLPGPLPWRDSRGRIFFPLRGSGWYWGIEVKQSLCDSFPSSTYRIHEIWTPTLESTERPFAWIADMYDERAEMKRNGNPAQKALKLAMNSVYGKLAQSVGAVRTKDGWQKPKWHHALYAGWVTAATRAQISYAIRYHRQNLVAIETDAVFMSKPIPDMPLGDRLGEWEMIEIPDMLYISSGVYYAIDGDNWKFKSRGVESDKSKPIDYWLDIFSRIPHKSVEVTMTLRRFGTDIRQPKRFARWYDHTLTTTIPGGVAKRVHLTSCCVQCETTGKSYAEAAHYLIVPQALIDSDTEPSTPYNFPWRTDVDYEWPTSLGTELIEQPSNIEWET